MSSSAMSHPKAGGRRKSGPKTQTTSSKQHRSQQSVSKKPTGNTLRESFGRSTATFYAIQGGNDLYWRVEAPARAINAKLCIMPEVGAAYSLLQPNTDSEFQWVATDEGADYPLHEGAAVWTRPDLARATHAKAMKELHGVRIVAELDDNYLNPAMSEAGYVFNYFMHVNKMDETARMDHMKSCASMDGIIVTTDYLRDLYHKTLKKELDHVPDIFICGNHIEVDRWPTRVESVTGKLRVGFMGSPSHRLDIKLAFPAFKWAYDMGHEIVFIGYDPQWRRFMDYTHIPWTDSTNYRAQGLPLDVGLAPLRYDRHTLGKTDIKAMEYLMSGAVPICSNMPVYNRTFKHNETALLGSSREELLTMTMRACTDRKLRERILDEGCQYIREERDITKHADEWRQAVCGD